MSAPLKPSESQPVATILAALALLCVASCGPPTAEPIGGSLEEKLRDGWENAESASVDHSLFNSILESHVDIQAGTFNYAGALQERSALDSYLTQLDNLNMATIDKSQQKAVWINAYNAYTIKLILESYSNEGLLDIKSIKDIPSPWDTPICKVSGKTLTLNDIEHKILRPLFNDPRIHFAINCASVSCPVLRDFAFTGENVEDQLEKTTRATLRDDRYVSTDGRIVTVSKIMNWYEGDFVAASGSLTEFLKPYVHDVVIEALDKGEQIRFKDYDWSLNKPQS